jgi:hypothetical protein
VGGVTVVQSERFKEVNMQARPYPSYLLPEEGTALCLFAAAFFGWNDGIHMIRAGLTCDFVDYDRERLWEMASIYPEGHAFYVEDAWAFAARAALNGREWDVVTVDPFFDDAAERALRDLGLWTTIATKLLTLTVHSDHEPDEIEGWNSSLFPRSDRTSWLVMTRA